MSNRLIKEVARMDGVLEAELLDRDGIEIECYPESKPVKLGVQMANYVLSIKQAMKAVGEPLFDTMLITHPDRTMVTTENNSTLLVLSVRSDANLGELLGFYGTLEIKLDEIGVLTSYQSLSTDQR